MKTIQLLRLISIINSLLIIPACSAQNPSESLLEDVLEDYLLITELITLLILLIGKMNWKNFPIVCRNQLI